MDLSVDDIILGIITIFIGLFVCLFSIRALKVVSFFVGFLIGYFSCQMVLSNLDLENNPDKETIYTVSTLVSAIVCGFIVLFVLHVGLFIIGAVGGFFTAVWILSFLPETSQLQEPTYSGLFIGFFVLLFCVITYFYKTWILIVSSSIIGSYVTFYGIDRFAHTGYHEISQSIFDENFLHTVSNDILIMLLCNLVLAFIGFAVQTYTYIVSKKKVDKTKFNKLVNEEDGDEENL